MGLVDWKHWLVILLVVVLVFGTKKLKGLGSDVGETIKGFRAAMRDDHAPGPSPAIQAIETASTPRAAGASATSTAEHSIRSAAE